ncbi:hypothetical protein ACKVWC_011567 [Pyricularia oryzae]
MNGLAKMGGLLCRGLFHLCLVVYFFSTFVFSKIDTPFRDIRRTKLCTSGPHNMPLSYILYQNSCFIRYSAKMLKPGEPTILLTLLPLLLLSHPMVSPGTSSSCTPSTTSVFSAWPASCLTPGLLRTRRSRMCMPRVHWPAVSTRMSSPADAFQAGLSRVIMYQTVSGSCSDRPGSLPSPRMLSILSKVRDSTCSSQRASGLPEATSGAMRSVKKPLLRRWSVVMSSGNSDSLSCRESPSGYGLRLGEVQGGMVEAGSCAVRAKTRAVATASAKVLNSATGVMLPGTLMAPPMTQTSRARRSVSGSSAAARARLVMGPMVRIVTVWSGDSLRIRRISLCASVLDGVKYVEKLGMSEGAPPGASSKRVRHVSAGVRSGC